MLGLGRAHVGVCYLGPMVSHVGDHVGDMLGHVKPRFGNLAEFRFLSKTWKRQDSEAIKASPKQKLSSYCTSFGLVRAHKKKNLSTFGAGGFAFILHNCNSSAQACEIVHLYHFVPV